MKLRVCFVIVSLLSALVCTTLAQTAASNPTPASTQVPRLIKFSGIAKDESGKPITGVVGITFSLYQDQQGGAPLWTETQNVQADGAGHYTALLGSATADGVPLALFSSAEVHWISAQISGQPEQPRVALLSVPYALKAADAETLGGLSASAFMHAPSSAPGSGGVQPAPSTTNTLPPAGVTGRGTKNFVPLWTGATTQGNSVIYQTGGNVGVGTKTPKAALDVAGTGTLGIQSTVPGTQAAIAGVATATKGGATGVYGQSSDPTGNAVFGMDNATTGGIGVIGQSTATSGSSFGVFGQSASTSGAGVQGNETAKTGGVAGVTGTALSTGQFSAGVSGYESAKTGEVFGVSGSSNSSTTNSAGVVGVENATTGAVSGVAGNTNSTTNGAAGVGGFEGGATGQVYGVTGGTNSTTNFAAGVSGFEGASSGAVFGVTGSTNSTTSGASGLNGFEGATTGGPVYGVSGYAASTGGIGVFGSAQASSGFAVGVEGATNSPAGVGGQFVNVSGSGLVLVGQSGSSFNTVFSLDASGNGFYAGNLNVTGKLTKGSGSFKIDHPLDPANKYLSHSFVESPDMMNVYNGVVVLDAHGSAWVTLPDYFEALNRDFRYQLTAIGAPGRNLYVAQEVAGNRFRIAGGKPRAKVSWQVTGIRQDAYANAYRIPTEEEKPAAEQGYYLHPEVFGQPASKSIQSASQKASATEQLAKMSNP